MGTTVQSISGRATLQEAPPGINGGGGYYPQRASGWEQRPAHSIESPEAVFSPQSRNAAPPYGPAQGSSYEAQQASAAHQQEQRNVHHLQNAAATVGGQPSRHAITPTPGVQGGQNGAQQPGMEKRGPVEFNHAISYVNKIKVCLQER